MGSPTPKIANACTLTPALTWFSRGGSIWPPLLIKIKKALNRCPSGHGSPPLPWCPLPMPPTRSVHPPPDPVRGGGRIISTIPFILVEFWGETNGVGELIELSFHPYMDHWKRRTYMSRRVVLEAKLDSNLYGLGFHLDMNVQPPCLFPSTSALSSMYFLIIIISLGSNLA